MTKEENFASSRLRGEKIQKKYPVVFTAAAYKLPAMNRSFRSPAYFLTVALILALLGRAMVPAGFMPVFSAAGLTITGCENHGDEGAGDEEAADHHDHDHHSPHQHDHSGTAHKMPCSYAAVFGFFHGPDVAAVAAFLFVLALLLRPARRVPFAARFVFGNASPRAPPVSFV